MLKRKLLADVRSFGDVGRTQVFPWPRQLHFCLKRPRCRCGWSKVIRASAKGDQWALALLLLAEMEKEGLGFYHGWLIRPHFCGGLVRGG